MSYALAPYETRQYFDDNGDPLNGGLVYTWLSGTATPATTYSNSTGTQNTNPIVLSASGRAQIYLDPSHAYKFNVTTALGVAVGYTVDPVNAVNAGSSGLGEIFVFGSNSASPITNTSYVSGATFDKLQPGSGVYAADAANIPAGTYKLQVTGLIPAGGTLTVAIVNLSDGAPDTPLETCAATSTTGQVVTSGAITFGAAGTTKLYGIKPKVSANSGYLKYAALVRTA